jgi:hypothetical protein
MVWAVVCLIAGLSAQLTGPDTGAVHLVSLVVGAIALAMLLRPDWLYRASWRRPQ